MDLAQIASSATLNERCFGGQAQAIDVLARWDIVQGVHDDVKFLDVADAEGRRLYISYIDL